MATAILKLTEAQLEDYLDLANNSGNRDYTKQHGIPVEGESPITYSVVRQIPDKNKEQALEFLVQIWGRSAHPKDDVRIPMHLEIQAENDLATIALHDDHQDSQSVERICVEVSSEHIPLDSLPDTLLLGYTIPSAGLPQRIMSLVFPDAQNSRILRFFGSAVSGFSEYIIPDWYKGTHVYLSQVKDIFKLTEAGKKKFSRETGIFEGITSARKALLTDLVREAEKWEMMTPERYRRLLEEAELPKQVKICSSSGPHTTVELKHPDAAGLESPLIETVSSVHVYSYNPGWLSDFSRRVKERRIPKGALVYYRPLDEEGKVGIFYGVARSQSYHNIEEVIIHFPGEGLRNLEVDKNLKSNSYWLDEKIVPEGIILPDRTRYDPSQSSILFTFEGGLGTQIPGYIGDSLIRDSLICNQTALSLAALFTHEGFNGRMSFDYAENQLPDVLGKPFDVINKAFETLKDIGLLLTTKEAYEVNGKLK